MSDGLKVGSLHRWAHKDNPSEYNKIYVHDIILRKNSDFMEQQMSVANIVKYFDGFAVALNNVFCPFIKGSHDEPKCYIDMTKNGMVLRCRDKKCFGLTHPLDTAIELTRQQKNTLFNININIDQSTTNNYGTNGELIDNTNYLDIDTSIVIFEDTELNELILTSLSGTSCDIAQTFYYLYKDIYKCNNGGQWYIFKKHRWQRTSYVRNTVSVSFPKYYRQLYDFIVEHAQLNKFVNKVIAIIKGLKSTNFINNVIVEAANIFSYNDEEFYEKLDTNKYLLCFNNGVYDLETNEFRDGLPTDYLSVSCGYDYEEEPANIKDVQRIIKQIMPNEAIRDYMLRVMSTCLSGKVIQRVFLYNGFGSNGKSLLLNLLGYTLGPYLCKLPISLITQKRQAADNANPQLAKARRAKCIVFSEPNKTDKLNAGIIKEMTGGESITARGLYKDPIEFLPMFKVFVLCNFLPLVDEDDYGIWRRLRNIKFTSKFVDEPNPNKKNEFKIDYTLEDRLHMYKSSFMFILLEYWKDYQVNGIPDIKEVMQATNEYKKDNDFYQEYIDEFIEVDTEGVIKWTVLLAHFNDWYFDNYKKRAPKTREVKDAFIAKIFGQEIRQNWMKKEKVNVKGWGGFKLLEDNIDDLY
jgi:P4 family phage/plasmid primase-like protien